jgi:uncharacterized SAM-binding protein YcdF (DUF218 family)
MESVMAFTLKKIFSALLLPFPLALLCLLLGLPLLMLTKKKKTGIALISFSTILLFVFSFSTVPTNLLAQLESQYQPLTQLPMQTQTIVVLGGGVRNNTNAPPNTQLSAASLSRLLEGIRLYKLYRRQGKQATLMLSGGRVFGKPADAGMMQNTAIVLGIPRSDIKLESGSRNTAEEATYLKNQLANKPFILVTSAYHMPRAIQIFQQAGLKPIPAPTQFIAGSDRRLPRFYLPNAKYLAANDIAFHEYLGLLWFKLHHRAVHTP